MRYQLRTIALAVAIAIAPTGSFALADTVTNSKWLKFTVTSDISLSCDLETSYDMMSRDKSIKIPMTYLCSPVEGTKGTWAWVEIERSRSPNFAAFASLSLEAFASGDDADWPFSVPDQSAFEEYSGLELREIQLTSGEVVHLPYERIGLKDGNTADAYYVTVKIIVDGGKNYVLRHHAIVELDAPSGEKLRLSFGNDTFVAHHGKRFGINEPVREDVRQFVEGFAF